MEILKSELRNVNSALIRFDCEFIGQDETESKPYEEIENILGKLPVDLDFQVGFVENDFNVIVKVTINNEKNHGYYIHATQFNIYKIEKEDISNEEKNHWVNTAIGITINQAREVIYTNTMNCPMGPYRLPIINTSDLINKKFEQMKAKDEIKK